MNQLDVNDFCTCSFGVDNVVVFLFIRIITGNFDIVNMYKCSKSKICFVCLRQIVSLRPIGSKCVTVVECVNPCIVKIYFRSNSRLRTAHEFDIFSSQSLRRKIWCVGGRVRYGSEEVAELY